MDDTTIDTVTPPCLLPEWLTAYPPSAPLFPKYPTTKEQREIQELTFTGLFETALDYVIEGKSLRQLIEGDPRKITLGRFMSWVRKDTERMKRYEEAQLIGTEVIADDLRSISDGTDNNMEDVARSTLRINTRKFLMQSHHKDRYGEKKNDNATSIQVVVCRDGIIPSGSTYENGA